MAVTYFKISEQALSVKTTTCIFVCD